MRIVLIAKPGHENTGVGRYVSKLKAAFEELGEDVSIVHPVVPIPVWLIKTLRELLGWDLAAFFENYSIWAKYPRGADVYHITSQNLATLLLFCPPPGKTVITVHDIIPHLLDKETNIQTYRHPMHKFFDYLSNLGMKRADALISVSFHTRDTVVMYLGIDESKVIVTWEGVN